MKTKNFEFGNNWQLFIKKHLNQERVEEAKKALLSFCNGNKIKNKTFLDLGCGSGLFSLVAYQLGASEIMSFDVDKNCISCCEYLREKERNPANWKITRGSILNNEFAASLGRYDFVYSWGVLHHTGSMWKAIENALGLIKEGGLFYISIYNKAEGFGLYSDGRFGSSKFWEKVKKTYVNLPPFLQCIIDYISMVILVAGYLLKFKNPIKEIKGHAKLRGMSWRVDIRDWLGGYPYEYASVKEVRQFITSRGFTLENVKSRGGLRNNEYLFKKA